MTIETTLERIAAALEAIARSRNTTADAAPTDAPRAAKPARVAAAKPAPVVSAEPVKTAEQQPAASSEVVSEVSSEVDFLADEQPAKALTKDDVRKAMIDYQKATSQGFALKLLKKYGADTLASLSTAKYADIVDEAAKLTASKAAPQ